MQCAKIQNTWLTAKPEHLLTWTHLTPFPPDEEGSFVWNSLGMQSHFKPGMSMVAMQGIWHAICNFFQNTTTDVVLHQQGGELMLCTFHVLFEQWALQVAFSFDLPTMQRVRSCFCIDGKTFPHDILSTSALYKHVCGQWMRESLHNVSSFLHPLSLQCQRQSCDDVWTFRNVHIWYKQ